MKKKTLIICACALIVIIAAVLLLIPKEGKIDYFEGDNNPEEVIDTVKLGGFVDAKLLMNSNLSTLSIEILTEESFWDAYTDSEIIEISGPFDIYSEGGRHEELLINVKALSEGYAELILTNYAEGKELTLGLDCGLSEDKNSFNINVISSETKEVKADEQK